MVQRCAHFRCQTLRLQAPVLRFHVPDESGRKERGQQLVRALPPAKTEETARQCQNGNVKVGDPASTLRLLLLTLSLPRCDLKTTNKSANLKRLNLFVFFFALACKRSFVKARSTESRCVIGLLAGACVRLSTRKFYRLGQRRG